MARPKGKLLALVAIFVAVGLVTATGAFTTVTAERTATVEVSGDSSAILGISGADGPLGNIVSEGNDGVATIDLSDFEHGVNPDATTELSPLVNFQNNGQDDVQLTVTVDSVVSDQVEEGDVTVIDSNGEEFTGTTLSEGDSEGLGLELDLTDINQDNIESTEFEITITADANSNNA